jgi:hypothetical protein
MSGARFLKSSVLAGDCMKIFFPLAPNVSTFGYSTRITARTLCKAFATHVTCISSGQLTESTFPAFLIHGAASVTSNNTSNFTTPGHRVSRASLKTRDNIA